MMLRPSFADEPAQWNRFRGPNGTGIALAVAFPPEPTAADFAWKTDLPGKGSASPCVWNDRIFTLAGDPERASRTVICLDAGGGEILWSKTFSSKPYHMHRFNDYAPSTPAADAERVYVTWATADAVTLSALDHDGNVCWQRDLGAFASAHGYGVSPIVVGELVILCNMQRGVTDDDGPTGKSSVLAVDSATGETRWETARGDGPKAAYSTPFVRTGPGGRQELVTASTTHGIAGLALDSGKPLWQSAVFTARTVASPVESQGRILCSCGSGGGGHYVLAVRPDAVAGDAPTSAETGTQIPDAYQVPAGAPYVPTMLADDGLVYMWHDGGYLTCLRAEDGSRVYRQRLGGKFFASPIRAGDVLFNVAMDGTLWAVAAGEDFKVLGKTPLGDESYSTPAVAGDKLILRTFTKMLAIKARP
jgi:outer membrane protein assembly factor BamB